MRPSVPSSAGSTKKRLEQAEQESIMLNSEPADQRAFIVNNPG